MWFQKINSQVFRVATLERPTYVSSVNGHCTCFFLPSTMFLDFLFGPVLPKIKEYLSITNTELN